MGRRAAKRAETRLLIRDLRDDLAELPGLPGEEPGDCRHGCNGSPGCGPDCTFICHPEADEPAGR